MLKCCYIMKPWVRVSSSGFKNTDFPRPSATNTAGAKNAHALVITSKTDRAYKFVLSDRSEAHRWLQVLQSSRALPKIL